MACSLKHNLSSPITVQQFLHSFHEAWRSNISQQYQGAPQLNIPQRIGIAVSGGADSMALAYLCRQLQVTRADLDLTVKAFIIDHKARDESTEEAHTVSKWLSSLGIGSEILTLDWSTKKKISEFTAFETHARAKRYRALGKACYENQLSVLLTGHHLDDNVETAILRLTQHSKREGLAGISPVARIPECNGLWGISESGSFQQIAGQQHRVICDGDGEGDSAKNHEEVDLKTGLTRRTTFNMATGGILLCRPLLPFRKSGIIETCLQSNVPYVNDPTNFDATLTTRNAIRSLLSPNRLPRALQPDSLSMFIAKNRHSLQDLMLQTGELLQQCKLLEFHAGSSTMKIQFPSILKYSPSTKANNARVLAPTLRRITELVSPQSADGKSHSTLNEYARFAQLIFNSQQMEDFTVSGAHWRLLQPPDSHTNNESIWHISRAPFRARSDPVLRFAIGDLTKDWSSPVLWDNRFWFQFRLDPSSSPTITTSISSLALSSKSMLTIRPLKTGDMTQISMLIKRKGHSKGVIGYMAPFKSRFTMPVMTTNSATKTLGYGNDISAQGRNEELERYIALPTLDMKLDEVPEFQGRVEWRWGYKKIDLEALRLMGWLDSTRTERLYN